MRASLRTKPEASAIFIMPSQRVITPISPMESSTPVLALSIAASVMALTLPVAIPTTMPMNSKPNQMILIMPPPPSKFPRHSGPAARGLA